MPSLGLNPESYARYGLSALVQTTSSCVAAPVDYSAAACGTPGFIGSGNVYTQDDATCSPNDTGCSFSPLSLTISQHGRVWWEGAKHLPHTITFNSSLIQQITIGANESASQTFNVPPGTYTYTDTKDPSMTGAIVVIDTPGPAPTINYYNATGPVGWQVVDLDNGTALLNVTYNVNVYNASTSPQSHVATQSGFIEDPISIQTRIDSGNFLNSFEFPYIFGYDLPVQGIGPLYAFPGMDTSLPGVTRAVPTIGSYTPQVIDQGASTIFPCCYPYPYYYYPQTMYTIWWVNGPLSSGSTVPLLTVKTGVRGSETVNLGSLGNIASWIVGSRFQEYFSNLPADLPTNNYGYYVVNSTNYSNLHSDYGKASDLLLGLSDKTSLYYENLEVVPTGGWLYSGTTDRPVQITRVWASSVSLSLNLSSTNLDLTKSSTPQSYTKPLSTASFPIMYSVAGIVAAATVGLIVWIVRRSRKTSIIIPSANPPVSAPV